MKKGLILFILLCICSPLCCDEMNSGDSFYSDGLKAFGEHNYEKAFDLFNKSVIAYDNEGNSTALQAALLEKKRCSWMFMTMGLNRTMAREVLITSFPNFSTSYLDQFLEKGKSIQIESGGETWYFVGIANNIAFHNNTIMQGLSREQNHSAFFDEVYPLIRMNRWFGDKSLKPLSFMANSSLSIPRELLPENGTLKVWFPLPIEAESQENISIISLQPEEYVRSGPVTTGDLGQVYFEIPLSEMNGQFVNLSADFQFSTYERSFRINPDTIEPYDTRSDLYKKYTASQPDIEITPEVITLAESIAGSETNPYRKAELFFEYIITTYPYSTVSHTYLAAANISESGYLLNTGFGDCGTQSALFVALCRASGIPARCPGGYQLASGIAGPHFWAEFYLPGYGWIPVDVTIAETADWAWNRTDDERRDFKQYFFGNMDPYRCIFQNDLDIPFTPDPGIDQMLKVVHQTPAVVCSESREDIELMGLMFRNITFTEIS